MPSFFADYALLPHGLQANVRVSMVEGVITSVQAGATLSSGEQHCALLLPALPNLHSHAFQRAMAGLAEVQGDPNDSFWTWRERMYALAAQLDPAQLFQIALNLYQQMRRAGYGHVCEFHYLHHQAGGKPYAPAHAMSLALIEAAREADLGLTLLPVLYMSGGFDGAPLSCRQQRFGHSVENFLRLAETLMRYESADLRVGLALHSLRAVPASALTEVLTGFGEISQGPRPIHIHISEQQAEVDACLAERGCTPISWLMEHAPVDQNWCLVHATHASAQELAEMAKRAVVVGLCPTTEANLGDGLFPLPEFLAHDGRWGIGSDSQICVDPFEELRWLEYGQRLRTQRRNVLARTDSPRVAENLYLQAARGGSSASGLALGQIAMGASARLLSVRDPQHLRCGAELLSTLLFRVPHELEVQIL